MFRMPGKEGSPAEKEAEKALAKQQVKQQLFLFIGIVTILRAGNSFIYILLIVCLILGFFFVTALFLDF